MVVVLLFSLAVHEGCQDTVSELRGTLGFAGETLEQLTRLSFELSPQSKD